jgi:hypothetical protein
MKYISAVLMLSIFISVAMQAQDTRPVLLKEPVAWSFERFALPPAFAPNIPYNGAEELRFSPGMFDKNSPDYFTYAFAAQLNNRSSISKAEIRAYLLDYFKGLCSSTAKERKLVVDTSRITVSIEQKKDLANEIVYNAVLHVYGVFADGADVQLNMEVKVLADPGNNKVYLIFIASPHAKTDETWTRLYSIQKNFALPVEEKKP